MLIDAELRCVSALQVQTQKILKKLKDCYLFWAQILHKIHGRLHSFDLVV